MALMACGECGRQVSSEAKSCPNCGWPVRPIGDTKAHVSVTVQSPETLGSAVVSGAKLASRSPVWSRLFTTAKVLVWLWALGWIVFGGGDTAMRLMNAARNRELAVNLRADEVLIAQTYDYRLDHVLVFSRDGAEKIPSGYRVVDRPDIEPDYDGLVVGVAIGGVPLLALFVLERWVRWLTDARR